MKRMNEIQQRAYDAVYDFCNTCRKSPTKGFRVRLNRIIEMSLKEHGRKVRSQTIEDCLKICDDNACGCINADCDIDEVVGKISQAIREMSK